VIFHRTLEPDAERRAADLLDLARRTHPDVVVVINPNNPDGFAYDADRLTQLLADLSTVCGEVILDDSFAGLAVDWQPTSARSLVEALPNLVIIRSLSKEYGIAGLRLGYAIARPERIRELSAGVLWNINGLGEHFIRALCDHTFCDELATARDRYLCDVAGFLEDVARVPHADALPSRTNFVLLRLAPHVDPHVLVGRLLYRNGIYVRPCEDKIGLDASFVRVAAGRAASNQLVIDALACCLG